MQELDLALLDILLPPFQAEVRQCVFEEKLPRGGNPRDDPVVMCFLEEGSEKRYNRHRIMGAASCLSD